jgi:thioesterase domain-containing protein
MTPFPSPGGETVRPVVFLFPGLTGNAEELSGLRNGCGNMLSTVPIVYPHWSEIRSQGIGLDDFVAHCKAQIEAYPACGPRLLAGYSFGGHIAFAVAADLESSGRTVGRLGLLDTAAIPPFESGRRSLARRLRDLAKAFRGGEIDSEIGRLIAGGMRRSGYNWPLRLAARLRYVRLPRNIGRHIDLALQMYFDYILLLQLLDRMACPSAPCRFPAVLLRCVNHGPDEADHLQWDRHLGRLSIVPILGDHFSLMAPQNIASLCRALSFAMTGTAPQLDGFRGEAHIKSH